jgi:hypothetical protein
MRVLDWKGWLKPIFKPYANTPAVSRGALRDCYKIAQQFGDTAWRGAWCALAGL